MSEHSLIKPADGKQTAPVDVFGSTVADILMGRGSERALAISTAAEIALEVLPNGEPGDDGEAPLRLRLRLPARTYGEVTERQRPQLQQQICEAAGAVVDATLPGKYLASVLITPALSANPTWREESQAHLEQLAAAKQEDEFPF